MAVGLSGLQKQSTKGGTAVSPSLSGRVFFIKQPNPNSNQSGLIMNFTHSIMEV